MDRRPIGSTRLLGAFLGILLLLPTLTMAAGPWSGKVVKLYDGDTIYVRKQQQTIKVRLWGVDAPELRQAYGREALAAAQALVAGKRVTVYPRGKASHERPVVTVILPDGRDLGLVLMHAGLGWWDFRYARKATLMGVLEDEARTMKRGLWQDPTPMPPWEWRQMKKAGGAP